MHDREKATDLIESYKDVDFMQPYVKLLYKCNALNTDYPFLADAIPNWKCIGILKVYQDMVVIPSSFKRVSIYRSLLTYLNGENSSLDTKKPTILLDSGVELVVPIYESMLLEISYRVLMFDVIDAGRIQFKDINDLLKLINKELCAINEKKLHIDFNHINTLKYIRRLVFISHNITKDDNLLVIIDGISYILHCVLEDYIVNSSDLPNHINKAYNIIKNYLDKSTI